MRLIYHPGAERELIEAARYYEGRVATLGVQFLNEADRAIAIIHETPARWRVIEEKVRGLLGHHHTPTVTNFALQASSHA